MQDTDRERYYAQLPYPEAVTSPGPSPDDPPWGPGVAFSVWIVSVLLILVVPAVFLIPYILSVSPGSDTEQMAEIARTDPTAIIVQIAAIIPAHALTLLLAWLVATRFRKYTIQQTLGMESGGFRWWHYGLILVAFFAVANVVGYYVPEQEHDLERMLRSSRGAVYVIAFLATFTAPAAEEIVYRGLVYSGFRKTLGVAGAFIAVTLLFVVVHVPQYYPSYATISLLTLLSIILTSVRVISGNLWPCIVLHTLFNGIQSLALILEPTLKTDITPVPVEGMALRAISQLFQIL